MIVIKTVRPKVKVMIGANKMDNINNMKFKMYSIQFISLLKERSKCFKKSFSESFNKMVQRWIILLNCLFCFKFVLVILYFILFYFIFYLAFILVTHSLVRLFWFFCFFCFFLRSWTCNDVMWHWLLFGEYCFDEYVIIKYFIILITLSRWRTYF